MDNMKFNSELIGYRQGQSDFRITAEVNNKTIGYIDYSVYENKPSIKYVFVTPEYRRQGIGTKLLQQIQKQYPETEINLGMSTDDGSHLVKSLNRQFTKNPDFKHIHLELKQLKERKAILDKEFEDFHNNPTEEKRKNILQIGDEWNNIVDKIRDLEKLKQEIKPGKWLIDFKEWINKIC